MLENKTIAICIATYARNSTLKECIISVLRSARVVGKRYCCFVVVVDNNPQPIAADIVKMLNRKSDILITYHWESKAGIPFARNACLENALKHDAEYIAFIDDDETADEQWLTNLTTTMEQLDVDVVSGQVIQNAKKGPIAKRLFITAAYRDRAETDNVLFKSWIAKRIRFNENMEQTGGSDTLFFRQAHKMGAIIISCSQAFVYENVPNGRLNTKWILKRNFRMGLTNVTIEKHLGTKYYRLLLFVRATVLIQLGAVECLPQCILAGWAGVMKGLTRIARGIGTLAGLLGYKYEEYRRK